MQPFKVPRWSAGLQIIGYTLWVPAILILALSTIMAIVSVGGVGSTTSEVVTKTRHDETTRLRGIVGMPAAVVDDFADDGLVGERALASLTPEQLEEVNRAKAQVSTARVVGVGGTAATVGLGGCGLVVLYFFLVPIFIIGLVLMLNKRVWRCSYCGFIYDRA